MPDGKDGDIGIISLNRPGKRNDPEREKDRYHASRTRAVVKKKALELEWIC